MANKAFDVENVSKRAVSRAGRTFPPKSKKRVVISDRRERELRAPKSLRVSAVEGGDVTEEAVTKVIEDEDEDEWSEEPPTVTELRGMRKGELVEVAERYGLGMGETSTRDELFQGLVAFFEEEEV